MRVLANDGIDDSAKAKLESQGFTVVTDKVDQENLISEINAKSYEVIIVRSATKITADVLNGCKGIKLIGRAGVGLDNIDLETAKSNNVKVFNTPGSSSQAVAELVMGHMYSLSRFIYDSNRNMPFKGSDQFSVLKKSYGKGIELRGKTLGIIGFGRIGVNLAKYAVGTGMRVLAVDNKKSNSAEVLLNINDQDIKINVPVVNLDEALEQSDFISLHVPKLNDGGYVLGNEEFAKMKDKSFLINAARGGVIDENALIEVLDSGKLSGAALDVYVNEPKPSDNILKHPKISLTPHTGAATVEAQKRIGQELVSNILSFYGKA